MISNIADAIHMPVPCTSIISERRKDGLFLCSSILSNRLILCDLSKQSLLYSLLCLGKISIHAMGVGDVYVHEQRQFYPTISVYKLRGCTVETFATAAD